MLHCVVVSGGERSLSSAANTGLVLECTLPKLLKSGPTRFLNSWPGASSLTSVIDFSLITDTHASFEEEEALLSEMDVTGQAFEDMQEQNSRLLQQLREKDDANFKLMSERIKSNQIYKLLKEEKEELADQVLTFKTQVKCN